MLRDLGSANGVRIGCVVVGPLLENCYLVAGVDGGDAIVIDPGDEPERILNAARGWGLTPRLVVNTHGHMDHIGGNAAIVSSGAELAIHGEDAAMLTDPAKNLSAFLPPSIVSPAATRLIEEGEEIAIGAVRLRVIHTPGHTPGGVCLDAGGVLFSGDTLFDGSVGRVDLPGGSWEALMRAITDRLLPLGDGVRVLPGHGPETTVGEERRSNPFVREWLAGRVGR